MKKKELFFVGLCAFGLCSLNVQAFKPQSVTINIEKTDNHIPTGAEMIELLGKLDYNSGFDDIEAGATDNAVYIYFNQNFGSVSISLYNPTGNLVYNCVVNTAVQQLVVIPITSTANGIYSVLLSNANGYAEGDFERN